MLVVGQLRPPPLLEADQEVDLVDHPGVDEEQSPLGPGSLLARLGDHQDGVDHWVDAHLAVPAEQPVHLVDDVVAHRMLGIFQQEVAGDTGVEILVVGQVVGEAPHRVLEPAFGGPGAAQVRVMLGEPLLEEHRPGIAALGEQAGQAEILDRDDLRELFAVASHPHVFPPLPAVHVQGPEDGLMPFEQVLRVADEHRAVGFEREDDRGPARS